MKRIYTLFFLTILLLACQDSFLDIKSDKKLLIPTKLDDFQSLLDNSNVINVAPALGFIASELFTTAEGFQSMSSIEKNSYLWTGDGYEGIPSDWETPYQQVFYANVVLEGLGSLKKEKTNESLINEIKGRALFIRANAFFNLVNTFALPFGAGNEEEAIGIPIRVKADVNEISHWASLSETYNQIVSDLKDATRLLPTIVNYNTRPTKQAAFALLSRVHLVMNEFEEAINAATSSLNIYSELLDFNSLDLSLTRPFSAALPNGNIEVLYYSSLLNYSYTRFSVSYIENDVYKLYADDDLRKFLFFYHENGNIKFKGSYSGYNSPQLNGTTVAEVYLTRAECLARLNDGEAALRDLNYLLQNRWKKERFKPYEIDKVSNVLDLILIERRKELIGRGVHWLDLRRLNHDQKYAVTLRRNINGIDHELDPNSNKYVFPIPIEELSK